MITNPRIDQTVFIHYMKSADSLPYQNRFGIIRKKSKGRPRNHLVEVPRNPDDFEPGQFVVPLTRLIVVPCGNLFTISQMLGMTFFTSQKNKRNDNNEMANVSNDHRCGLGGGLCPGSCLIFRFGSFLVTKNNEQQKTKQNQVITINAHGFDSHVLPPLI